MNICNLKTVNDVYKTDQITVKFMKFFNILVKKLS